MIKNRTRTLKQLSSTISLHKWYFTSFKSSSSGHFKMLHFPIVWEIVCSVLIFSRVHPDWGTQNVTLCTNLHICNNKRDPKWILEKKILWEENCQKCVMSEWGHQPEKVGTTDPIPHKPVAHYKQSRNRHVLTRAEAGLGQIKKNKTPHLALQCYSMLISCSSTVLSSAAD